MKRVHVDLAVGHPYKAHLTEDETIREVERVFGDNIQGLAAMYGGIARNKTFTVVRLTVFVPGHREAPPDKVLTADINKALTAGGTPWVFMGWDTWLQRIDRRES